MELHEAMPKKICAVCTTDLKTCSEILDRFKQADEYLQDIAQSPMFTENDIRVNKEDFAMDSNTENSSPMKGSVLLQKRLTPVKDNTSRESNMFTPDNASLVKSSSNIRPASSPKRVKFEKTFSQQNGKGTNPTVKQEMNCSELEDSKDNINSSITRKPYTSKVTFEKDIETIVPVSERIDSSLEVVNQNSGNSKRLAREMLSPSSQQPKSRKSYEVIVGSKLLRRPDSDKKPQASNSAIYKCDICSTELANPSALTAHKKKEHPDAKLRCPDLTCDYSGEFSSTAQLDEHYKKRHGLNCTLCNRIFLSSSSLCRHRASDHPLRHSPVEQQVVVAVVQSNENAELETSRVCWICGAVLKNNVYLDRHIVTVHWEKKHVCVICDKGFPTELALQNHVKVHDPEQKVKRFFCQQCPKSFWSKHYLKGHSLVHASLKPYVCETCGYGFVHKRNLVRHRHMRNLIGVCPKSNKKSLFSLKTENSNKQEAEKKFECDICKRIFIRKNNYDRHVKYHFCNGDPQILKKLLEEPEIHECGICKRVLLSKTSLQLHVSSHMNSTKPFQCEFCEKSFSIAHDYRSHEREHTGEMPFQCSYCGQTFSRKTQLEIHESKHSDEKPFECPICKKTFKRRKLLLNHTFTHKEASRAIRPHHCTHCWKGFITQQHLVRHLKANHQGNKAASFYCTECSKKFKQVESLKRHIETKHVYTEGTTNPEEEVKEGSEDVELEDDSTFQFMHFVENEEVVEDEQWENFPYPVIANECVISS